MLSWVFATDCLLEPPAASHLLWRHPAIPVLKSYGFNSLNFDWTSISLYASCEIMVGVPLGSTLSGSRNHVEHRYKPLFKLFFNGIEL